MARGPTSEPAASELPPEQSGVWTPMTRPDGRATATRLGRYWLFWQIAKGGMGTVYVARMKASPSGCIITQAQGESSFSQCHVCCGGFHERPGQSH